jgi:hypothetical protein
MATHGRHPFDLIERNSARIVKTLEDARKMCNTICVQEVCMTKNITLRMDEQLLKDVKHIAVEEDMSVSAWIIKAVKKAAIKDVRYDEAKAFIMKAMEDAPDYGGQTFTRDELHER